MLGLFLLTCFVMLGMGASYLNLALKGGLWQGDTEPNPLYAQFWTDLVLYFFKEHVGRTLSAFITALGVSFALANGVIDTEAATWFKLMVSGVAGGFIADITLNKANWR